MKWPWISRKTAQRIADTRAADVLWLAEKEQARRNAEWQAKWGPLLKDAIAIRAQYAPDYHRFQLCIGVDRAMCEMAASRNDKEIWGYIAKQLAWEFEQQMATLNFAGLHKLADETERRLNRFPRRGGIPKSEAMTASSDTLAMSKEEEG